MNAYALKEEEEEVPEAVKAIRVGLVMGLVMISTTILIATTMVEIAVDLMSIQIGAQNAFALHEEMKSTHFGKRSLTPPHFYSRPTKRISYES